MAEVRRIELTWRIVREACWPGLVVLVAHTVLGDLFGHEPTSTRRCIYREERRRRLLHPAPAPSARLLRPADATRRQSARLWFDEHGGRRLELGEYLSDLCLGTHIQRDVGNTLRDLLNGMAGAGAFLIADHLRRLRDGDS
jgi:hypothetical protein